MEKNERKNLRKRSTKRIGYNFNLSLKDMQFAFLFERYRFEILRVTGDDH